MKIPSSFIVKRYKVKKIINPYAGTSEGLGYNCFACAPENTEKEFHFLPYEVEE